MTPSTESRLSRGFAWSVDHPRSALIITCLLVVLLGLTLPKAQVDFSIEQLYPQDSELAETYKEHTEAYGTDDNTFFVARAGDSWDPTLRAAEARLREIDGVKTTLSPFSMERLKNNEGLLEMTPLQPEDADVLSKGTVIGVSGSGGAVIVNLEDTHNNHDARETLLSEVEEVISRLEGEWHMAGMPVIRTAYVRLVLKDLRVLIPLSILVAGFFFVLSFRDTRQVLVGLLSITLGMLSAAAAYIAAGGVVNTFSPAFFSVVVVVGTSDLIHLVHRFSDHIDDLEVTEAGPGVKAAARKAAKEIGFSCLLTTVTTAIGFLALLWTDLPTIQMFGLGAGMGVVITYLITFLVAPPLLSTMRPPSPAARQHATDGSLRMKRLGTWVVARRRPTLAIIAVISVGLAFLGAQTEAGYRLLGDLGNTEAGQAQEFMETHMGAVLPMSVDIQLEGDARAPETLAAIDELTNWSRAQPLVGHATSIADLTRLSWSTLSGEPDTLPPSQSAASQALFALDLGTEDPVSQLMIEDGSRTRIILRIKDAGGDAMVKLAQDLRGRAETLLGPHGGTVTITGVAYIIQWINRTLTQQFVGSFAVAILLIGLAWTVATRSVRRVAMALIPNILPLLAVLAALGLTGIPLKPTTAMVFSIGLGIAVDDTIHFLTAYERWRRDNPACTAEEAAQHAYGTAGRSMLDTSIVLVAGMLVLTVSDFRGFLYLGGFTAWAIVAALITDLLLLGPLLVALDDR